MRTRQGIHHYDELFKDPRDRRPDVVAEADYRYKKMLRDFSESRHGVGG